MLVPRTTKCLMRAAASMFSHKWTTCIPRIRTRKGSRDGERERESKLRATGFGSGLAHHSRPPTYMRERKPFLCCLQHDSRCECLARTLKVVYHPPVHLFPQNQASLLFPRASSVHSHPRTLAFQFTHGQEARTPRTKMKKRGEGKGRERGKKAYSGLKATPG